MTTKEIMQRAAAALDDKMGKDITVLKIADVSTLADYFLICTGTSSTQIRALCDAVEEAMDQAGETLISREGHVLSVKDLKTGRNTKVLRSGTTLERCRSR